MPRAILVLTMAAGLGVAAIPAAATWSIVMADSETKEVAVGTVTCLTGFDLLAIVPVVVVGEGAAAVQAAGDFAGVRRPIIFDGLGDHTPPADILATLATIGGHQSRQYGIADTRHNAITFTGTETLDWAGGVTGAFGTTVYAIQGNILVGACVVDDIEAAILATDGDMAERLMAGMAAAQLAGGDGRCSCSPAAPESCGCPPRSFTKSGHIGGMVVARIGDSDDPACTAAGCVDGSYYMRLNVPGATAGNPDPVDQLRTQFDAWRDALEGRPDAMLSSATFDPASIPADGVSASVMTITLRDWQGEPIATDIAGLSVSHAPGSAGGSSIGVVDDLGGGVFAVTLTAGTESGIDLFRVKINDGIGPVTLSPYPRFAITGGPDLDDDGDVDFTDLLTLLAAWGPCPPPPDACAADLDGDGLVGFVDLLTLLAAWG
ncbi:MAG: DUF1028 domain-containing protein [Phycisphaerales bacterium]|nr:DUF1028 domain-containing protein [Phycisphaerales bacterium]